MFQGKLYCRFAALLGIFGLNSPSAAASTLAAVEPPMTGSYISYGRVIAILVLLFGWLYFSQWMGQDVRKIRKLNEYMWKGVVLGGGALGLIILLFGPWRTTQLFAAGFGLWFVLIFFPACIYVVIRNSYVDVSARVFTPTHFRLMFQNMGKGQKEKMDTVERVRLTKDNGEKVERPDDKEEAEAYEATQDLLFDAFWRRATEVNMILRNESIQLSYRIDGVMTPREELLEDESAEAVFAFIKKIAGLDPDEHRRPQSGSFHGGISGGQFKGSTEVEVQSSGTTQEERLTFEIVGEQSRLRIDDLGMTEAQKETFKKYCEEPAGLVLVSGPRASGVTSTLYAAIRSHDSFMQNLLTLEREPLYDLENVTQHIYDSTKHEASYARQLQTVLRREPDVVLISDCPDRETAHLAVKAACEGKKIYMGVQARDSFEALKKVVSLAGDMDAVADALYLVTCQRLIRKLCIACRVAYRPDQQLLKKANLPADKIEHFYRPPKPEEMVDAKGRQKGLCPNCQGSGYFGRTAVFEMMEVNDQIRELIRRGQSLNNIRAAARKNGMLYLQEVGLQKVIEGLTSMNEVLRALRDEEPTPAAATAAATKKGG